MLAYSGIAHAGYMLMGLAVLSNDGLSAILFYIVVYLIMNLGAFLVVGMIANVTGDEDIESYRGLAWRGAIVPAVCLAVFLFSLTGPAAVRRFHRQVLPVLRGAQTGRRLRRARRGRRSQQRHLALLLRENRQDDVPRLAQSRGQDRFPLRLIILLC